jgi:choline dehydrogenase
VVANSVVVVGAGSAGCVLAARLSAEPRRHVVLIEAGPDYPSALPPDLADASLPASSHDWGLRTEPGGLDLPRARVVGGCSATNAGFWLRGWPADFDAWPTGWAFDALLPLFRSVEADRDFADEWHGVDGPVPISRVPVDDLEPYPCAFVDAAVACGHAAVADHNRPGAVGVGPTPRNVLAGVRMSTALTHLAPARARRNLEILPDTPVDRLELVDGRPRGVRTQRGDVIEADSVILAAGAYGSPAILLRSGIGPAAQLRALGITCVVDLPGVGTDLVDHPLVAVDLPATPGRRGPALPVLLTLRSTAADPSGPPDLHLFVAGPFDTPSVPSGAVFGIVTGLMSPRSRGSVRLRSADPGDPPVIDPGYLRHPDDVTRMVEATLAARRISRTRPLVDLVAGPEIAPGPAVDDDDVTGLAESICRRVGPYHHPVGTCAMGAVVDARGAVHGITGVLVADASIMPTIPSANTNASTIVVAERIASAL